MYYQRRAYRIVAQYLRKVSAWLKRMMGFVSSKPVTAFGVLVVAAAAVAIAVAGLLRTVDPVPLMVVGPFEIPGSKEPVAFTGKTLSNILVDDLQDIIQNGNLFQGLNPLSSRKQYGRLPNVPKIPIQTSFGLEIKGISLDQMRSLWNHLRYHQQLIDGDLVMTPNGGAVLILRLTSKGVARHWETTLPPPIDYRKLNDAIAYLAAELSSDMNPEITGRYFLGQHQFENAEEVLQQWAQREPGRAEPYYYLALSFAGADPPRRDEAAAMAKKARALDPKYHLAIGLLAVLEAFAHNLDGAIADNLAAHHLAPNAPNYLNNLAADYEQKGDEESDPKAKQDDYDKAISFAKEALHVDPDMVIADSVLGATLETRGDADGAIAAFSDAIKRRPDFLTPLQPLAELLIAKKKPEEAIELCRTSAALNPESSHALHVLGVTLVAAGRADEGIQVFREASKKSDASQEALLHADLAEALLKQAAVLLQQNRVKEATEYYMEALKVNPAATVSNSKFAEELRKLRKGKLPPPPHGKPQVSRGYPPRQAEAASGG